MLATKKNHGNRDLISEDPFESLRLNREVYAAHYAVGRVIILPQSFYSPLYIMLNEQEAEKIEHPLHTGLHEVDKQRPREILVWDVHYSYAAALNNLQIEDPEQVRAAER